MTHDPYLRHRRIVEETFGPPPDSAEPARDHDLGDPEDLNREEALDGADDDDEDDDPDDEE